MKERSKKNGNLSKGLHTGIMDKIFLESIRRWLGGPSVGTGPAFHGTRDEVVALADVLSATKAFHENVNAQSVVAESVFDALSHKQTAAANFHRIFGITWPLLILLYVNFIFSFHASV